MYVLYIKEFCKPKLKKQWKLVDTLNQSYSDNWRNQLITTSLALMPHQHVIHTEHLSDKMKTTLLAVLPT